LAIARSQVELERKRYQDLFEFMPQAYLVTDTEGKIQEANGAAATLLKVDKVFLVDKLLVNFIPPQERRVFRSKLAQLHQRNWVQEFSLHLQRRNGELFEAVAIVAADRDDQGKVVSLRWIVRDIIDRKRSFNTPKIHDSDPFEEGQKHFYSKGEIIRLEPEMIWIVCDGLVKLSTSNETGEEVVVGLAGASMAFGSGMTSLPTYQATALSPDVQLVCLSVSEIAASPSLAQALFPKISDRLRQTEYLLAISGKRQVKERLHHLLKFLQQEFGQKVAQGTRLSIRLTHQDIADASCTTRVTVTRLLGKLQQQGKIAFDSKQHILLKDEF
jgi:PAS domain S-box-containing protein